MSILLHITTQNQWQKARTRGEYLDQSLESEGFIHCSTLDQLLPVANSNFTGQGGLVLLVINSGRVEAQIRYEDCYETGQEYPHIYGPVPLTAVNKVVDFPAEPDGTFKLPPDL